MLLPPDAMKAANALCDTLHSSALDVNDENHVAMVPRNPCTRIFGASHAAIRAPPVQPKPGPTACGSLRYQSLRPLVAVSRQRLTTTAAGAPSVVKAGPRASFCKWPHQQHIPICQSAHALTRRRTSVLFFSTSSLQIQPCVLSVAFRARRPRNPVVTTSRPSQLPSRDHIQSASARVQCLEQWKAP